MGKQRIHLSVSDSILEKLDHIAVARDFSDRVALFEQLVREEWERRNGPATVYSAEPEVAAHKPVAPVGEALARQYAKQLRDLSEDTQSFAADSPSPEQVVAAINQGATAAASGVGTGVSYSAKPGRKRPKKP